MIMICLFKGPYWRTKAMQLNMYASNSSNSLILYSYSSIITLQLFQWKCHRYLQDTSLNIWFKKYLGRSSRSHCKGGIPYSQTQRGTAMPFPAISACCCGLQISRIGGLDGKTGGGWSVCMFLAKTHVMFSFGHRVTHI